MEHNILLYDLEIKHAIPDKKTPRLPDITYCRGWKDFEGMGISVIGAYTTHDDTYHIFCEENFSGFQALVHAADVVCGFNSESFDDRVCQANGIHVTTDYDILREVYKAKGLDPYPKFFGSEYKGYGLNALCYANGIGVKTGDGAHAPVLWQRGQQGKVIDYCLNDIQLTKKLFDKIYLYREIIDPNAMKPLYIDFHGRDGEIMDLPFLE